MSGYRLRYTRGTDDATRFSTIRYPRPWNKPCDTRERAELIKEAMPWPDRWEICEDGE